MSSELSQALSELSHPIFPDWLVALVLIWACLVLVGLFLLMVWDIFNRR